MYDIIEKKKLNFELTKEEISFCIDGYVKGDIPDYQMSALLMAICLNNLTLDETIYLTEAMINSGDTVNLSHINGIKVDKHSTGGVGDKTSLVLLPMLASQGLKVAKMSGRGLGYTGGTIDKLESIKGFNVNLGPRKMINILNENNFIICGQTLNIVPADKKLYALRDVTATVDNISLIASSIISKKIASGADYILLDVKVGSGAFMKNIDEAIKLSEMMVKIGKNFKKKVRCVITNMDEPLGDRIGNSLEVIEAIETLKNKGYKDLSNLCIYLAANIFEMTGVAKDMVDGIHIAERAIKSGVALEYFRKFIKLQNGNDNIIDNYNKFKDTKFLINIMSNKTGYIYSMNLEKIGEASLMLGAGREKKEDNIDYSAGIIIKRKVNDYVKQDDIIATMLTDKTDGIDDIEKIILNAYEYRDERNSDKKLIYGTVTEKGFVQYNNKVFDKLFLED